jgi:hypothetical protein
MSYRGMQPTCSGFGTGRLQEEMRSGGRRPVGRPRNRWEYVIQRDAANLLWIWTWKAAGRDKEEWRKKASRETTK